MQKAAPIGLPSVFEVAGAGEATCSRPAAVVMGESAGGNLATMAATVLTNPPLVTLLQRCAPQLDFSFCSRLSVSALAVVSLYGIHDRKSWAAGSTRGGVWVRGQHALTEAYSRRLTHVAITWPSHGFGHGYMPVAYPPRRMPVVSCT